MSEGSAGEPAQIVCVDELTSESVSWGQMRPGDSATLASESSGDPDRLRLLIIGLLQHPEAFEVARALGLEELLGIGDGEPEAQSVLRAASIAREQDGNLAYIAVQDRVLDLMQAAGQVRLDREMIMELLEAGLRPADDGRLTRERTLELLQEFLHSRVIYEDVARAIAEAHACSDSRMPEGFAALIGHAAEQVRQIETAVHGGALRVLPIGRQRAEIEAAIRRHHGRNTIGLPTGIRPLDNRLSGLQGLTLLSAAPGTGKTALALEIALHLARQQAEGDQCSIAFISLDMPAEVVQLRSICNLGDIEWLTLRLGSEEFRGIPRRDGHWTPGDAQRVEQAFNSVDQIGTRLTIFKREDFRGTAGQLASSYERAYRPGNDSRGLITTDALVNVVQHVHATSQINRTLLVVDYLQRLPVPAEVARRGSLESDAYRIELLQGLRDRCRTAGGNSNDLIILAITEARKPATSKEAWGSTMQDVLGAGTLTYSADNVVCVHRMTPGEVGRYYAAVPPADAGDSGARERSRQAGQRHLQQLLARRNDPVSPVVVSVDKSRNGERGTFALEFLFKKHKLRELSSRDARSEPRPLREALDRSATSADLAANGTASEPQRIPQQQPPQRNRHFSR